MNKLTELAESLVLKTPNLNVLRPEYVREISPLTQLLQEQLKKKQARNELLLPDLRALGNETVSIFSDYSGEGSGAYHTYSFLVCAWNNTFPFGQRMEVVREKRGLGSKEIEFKDFRLGQLRRALPEYLNLLNNIVPGFLLTVAVHKSLHSLFGPNEKSTAEFIVQTLEASGLGAWKHGVAEKLVRIVHMTAFLVGLLAHDGQKIFWMSDNDSVCANEELHNHALGLLQRVLGLYGNPNYHYPLLSGAVPFAQRDLHTLDLLSATDVVAGSIEHFLSLSDSGAPVETSLKPGVETVLRWLANDGIALKKMTVTLRPGSEGQIQATTLEFDLGQVPDGVTIIPVSM